jgi:hypothetical protein
MFRVEITTTKGCQVKTIAEEEIKKLLFDKLIQMLKNKQLASTTMYRRNEVVYKFTYHSEVPTTK